MNTKKVCDCTDYELVRELQDRGLSNRLVFWQDEDIECAFEDKLGYKPTSEQVDDIWRRMGHWFTDSQTEHGWDFIYDMLYEYRTEE